jgi:REP element-mobilizing transposase RayT
MPWGLKRFQQTRDVHFVTFSCYRRKPKLASMRACAAFLAALERVRQKYGLCVYGYVIMPEHVHLLMNEPEIRSLAKALQSLKQGTAGSWRCALRNHSGKPATTTSMCGANRSFWRSCDTFIAIRSIADWWGVRKIGSGAAFGTMRLEKSVRWRSNPSGLHAAENSRESC